MTDAELVVQHIRDAHEDWEALVEKGKRGHYMGVPLGDFTKDDLLAILAEFLELSDNRERLHQRHIDFLSSINGAKKP